MIAVEQYFRLDDRYDTRLLAEWRITRQGMSIGLEAGVRGNAVADVDDRAPLGKLGA